MKNKSFVIYFALFSLTISAGIDSKIFQPKDIRPLILKHSISGLHPVSAWSPSDPEIKLYPREIEQKLFQEAETGFLRLKNFLEAFDQVLYEILYTLFESSRLSLENLRRYLSFYSLLKLLEQLPGFSPKSESRSDPHKSATLPLMAKRKCPTDSSAPVKNPFLPESSPSVPLSITEESLDVSFRNRPKGNNARCHRYRLTPTFSGQEPDMVMLVDVDGTIAGVDAASDFKEKLAQIGIHWVELESSSMNIEYFLPNEAHINHARYMHQAFALAKDTSAWSGGRMSRVAKEVTFKSPFNNQFLTVRIYIRASHYFQHDELMVVYLFDASRLETSALGIAAPLTEKRSVSTQTNENRSTGCFGNCCQHQ